MTDSLPLEIDLRLGEEFIASGNCQLLDIREDWERSICRIACASEAMSIHIPMQEVPGRLDELDNARSLIVYCHHGVRSLQAVMWLRGRGFEKAASLAGGIDAWRREIEPGMDSY